MANGMARDALISGFYMREHAMSTSLPFRLRDGMTLIEIMIACTLMVIGLFAAIGAIANAHFTAQRRMYTDLAISEIQNQIELDQAKEPDILLNQFSSDPDIIAGEPAYNLYDHEICYFLNPLGSVGPDAAVKVNPFPASGIDPALERKRMNLGIDPNLPKKRVRWPGVKELISRDPICIRYLVCWVDQNGPGWVEQHFVYADRTADF